MKRKITILSVAAAVLIATGCTKNSFSIEGTMANGAGRKLYLEEITPEGTLFIDSVQIDSRGHYEITYEMPYPSLYNLHASANNYVVLAPEYGEKIHVDGDYEKFSQSYRVSGSPESTLLWQLQQYINDGAMVLNALVDTTEYYAQQYFEGNVSEATVLEKKEMTDSLFLIEYHAQQDYVTDFLDQNKGSLATLIALYTHFNNRPLINPRREESADYYDAVLEGLEERHPDNPHTQHFKISVERLHSALANQPQ